jgi:hypothetical protein
MIMVMVSYKQYGITSDNAAFNCCVFNIHTYNFDVEFSIIIIILDTMRNLYVTVSSSAEIIQEDSHPLSTLTCDYTEQ